MDTINFLITGVGGQGTVLASDMLAAVGLAAGYDVKKSDILGLAVRGGAVVGHIRWGAQVHSPIIPEGRADFLIAFEILEALRWVNQLRPDGTIIINQQQIHPVTVSSGLAPYPDATIVDDTLRKASAQVFRVPGLDIAQELGQTRVTNTVLLGVLSDLVPVEQEVWENVLKARIPARYIDVNLQALERGRHWLRAAREEVHA